jgi:hypothetical protein
MSIRNKNIIFFSLAPEDVLSHEIIKCINNNVNLKDQFIKLPVQNYLDLNSPPPYRLPKAVQKIHADGQLPVLYVTGFSRLILGKNAFTWITNELEKENNGGLEGFNFDMGFDDSCTIIDDNIYDSGDVLTEYNMKFSSGKGEINKSYANIDEATENSIVTYDEDTSKNARQSQAQQIKNRIESLKNEKIQNPNVNNRGFQLPKNPQEQMVLANQMRNFDTASIIGNRPLIPNNINNSSRSQPYIPNFSNITHNNNNINNNNSVQINKSNNLHPYMDRNSTFTRTMFNQNGLQ